MNISPINSPPAQSSLHSSAAEAPVAELRRTLPPPSQQRVSSSAETTSKSSSNDELSRDDLEAAVKEMNDFVKVFNNALQFNIDDDTGKTIVKVIDSSTKEVIRQVPSEEMLNIAKAIDKMRGLLIHQKA